jgi:rubrerythrin
VTVPNDIPPPPDSPARDARFKVVDTWKECANFPEGDPRRILEFMHRQMNEEMDATECSARTITDFPDAPWELRMFLARQCADEARHAWTFKKIFEKRGGKLGGRLAVQNRTFEAEGIDAIGFGIEDARKQGDEELAEFFDIQFADEIMHVRCANEFLHEMLAKEPRLALKVGTALKDATRQFLEVFGGEATAVTKYTISEQGRLEAGFRQEEVELSNRLAEQRRERAPT